MLNKSHPLILSGSHLISCFLQSNYASVSPLAPLLHRLCPWNCRNLHCCQTVELQRERERGEAMITRSNLAEQLREYQKRSKNSWTSFSFFSSTSSLTSARVDVAIVLALLVFSVVSLYFRRLILALILICIAILLLLCMRITEQMKLNRKRKRRMLLPLSI